MYFVGSHCNVSSRPREWVFLSYLIVIFLLASCGALPPLSDEPDYTPSSDQPDQTGLQLPPRSSDSKASILSGQSAIDQLLMSANDAMNDGRYDQASALVERAMRVEPMDPRSYFSLAQIRYSQQQFAQVNVLLRKAKALAMTDQSLLLAIEDYENRIDR